MADYGAAADNAELTGDDAIVQEANERWKACQEWQGAEDERTRNDIKFANADDVNHWQWPDGVYNSRAGDGEDGVALTINVTRDHNDLVINQISKSDFGVKVRPTGGKASYESAKVMQNIIRRIQNISQWTAQRRKVAEQQVDGGIGYIVIETRHVSERSFNQDIFLKASRDPTAVYLDPWIREPDGRDARFGFEFEQLPRKEFNRKYPRWKDKVGKSPLSGQLVAWLSSDTIVLAKYWRKSEEADTLVAYKDGQGEEVEQLASEIKDDAGKEIFKALIADIEEGRIWGKTRKVTKNNVEWFLIAGDAIVEKGEWAGKYIPICRCVGRELVIDNTLDRKGMTRMLIGPQRMLNYSASMSVEDVASQPKASFWAAARSVEGQEQIKTMNIHRHPVLLWNDVDDEAAGELQKVSPPIPIERPQPSQGHIINMQAAERWIMMVSGQFQAQMGENDTQSAASGKAINERKEQGDVATYHFPEHMADMERFIGVQLLDLIPKIYDTRRTLQIEDEAGKKHWIAIDPDQDEALRELQHLKEEEEAAKIALNPAIGEYECVSDPGPDYATQRQEGWNALTQLFAAKSELIGIAGDLLFKLGDFPGADELAQRLKRAIKADKPFLFDDKVEPQVAALQQQVKQLVSLNAELMTKLADMGLRLRGKDERRDIEAYREDTNRYKVVLDFLTKTMLTPQQQADLEHQLTLASHQHVYDMIQQANAPTVEGQSNGAGQ